MAPAHSRELVDSAIFYNKNGADGIEFNREILLDELQNETIEVDGMSKKFYQFIGKQVCVCASI